VEASTSASATFVEIEDEVHKRMMQLEAQVLQEAVQESSNREWRGKPAEEQPRCPRVPGSLESTRGPTNAPYRAMEDKASPCRGPTERAPRVGSVFFPLDNELGLLPGNLAPRQ
jgi:hypothetical protein